MLKDYTKYTVQDFLEDADFLEFAKNPTEAAQKSWKESLLHAPNAGHAFEEALNLMSALAYQSIKARSGAKDRIWKNIQSASTSMTPKSGIKRSLWPIIAGVAASLAFIVYFYVFRTDPVTEISPLAQNRMIRLPDSSFITLNAGSQIKFDRLSFKKKRIIQLEGEAYFQVKKGVDFVVKTELGEVKVLGTTFNVYSRKDIMNVSCLVGKVAVHFFNLNMDYTLTSGMEVGTENKVVRSSTFDIEAFKSWRDGYFYYNNAPLIQVMEELQRQYKLNELDFSNNLLKYRYSGFFKKDQLDDALQSVFLPLKLRAEIKNGILSVKEE